MGAKPKPKPNPKAHGPPFGGVMGGQFGHGGNDYGALPPAVRRRPAVGLNQMSPRGDYSLRANGPLPIRPPANPNIVPLTGQPSDLPKPRLEWTTKVDMEWNGAAGVIF